MYGNFGITGGIPQGYSGSPFFTPRRSSLIRTTSGESEVQGNLLQCVGQCVQLLRSLLQYGYEAFGIAISTYWSLAPVVSLVSCDRMSLICKKVAFFGFLTFLVFYVESLLKLIRDYFVEDDSDNADARIAIVVYDFAAQNEKELSVSEGDELCILHEKAGWCFVRVRAQCEAAKGTCKSEGWIPLSYIRVASHKL